MGACQTHSKVKSPQPIKADQSKVRAVLEGSRNSDMQPSNFSASPRPQIINTVGPHPSCASSKKSICIKLRDACCLKSRAASPKI